MEYAAFVFGIFGLLAYLEASSLKKRIKALEEQLAGVEGTAAFDDRLSLLAAIRSFIGQKVRIDLKEDCQDIDVVMYGNSRHGSNTILDADEDWVLVRIESAKGTKEKLIRLSSIRGIQPVSNQ